MYLHLITKQDVNLVFDEKKSNSVKTEKKKKGGRFVLPALIFRFQLKPNENKNLIKKRKH
jgi:hypothetical protein